MGINVSDWNFSKNFLKEGKEREVINSIIQFLLIWENLQIFYYDLDLSGTMRIMYMLPLSLLKQWSKYLALISIINQLVDSLSKHYDEILELQNLKNFTIRLTLLFHYSYTGLEITTKRI